MTPIFRFCVCVCAPNNVLIVLDIINGTLKGIYIMLLPPEKMLSFILQTCIILVLCFLEY